MARLMGGICRAGWRVVLGLIAVALLLGRAAREPVGEPLPGLRLPAYPRHHGVSGFYFARDGFVPRFLDTRSGRLTAWAVPGLSGADPLGCSPWRDGDGQHHLVVFCRPLAVSPGNILRPDFALLRCTYPAGRVVGRLPLEGIPPGNVCWAPDRSDRILYADADGRLYSCDFPTDEPGPGSTSPPRPRPVAWGCERPGRLGVFFKDPCWPDVSALGGRVFVGMWAWDDSSQIDRERRIWWLQLDPGGTEIVAAGPAIDPGADVPATQKVEGMPAVGATREGRVWLAYLAHGHDWGSRELWLTPIETDGPGRPPRISSAGRLLATDCLAIPPAFSPDGRWVYAARRDAQDGLRFERFEVAPPTESSRPDPVGE